MTKAKQVFISHAKEDAQFAHRLADDLRRMGVQVWIAPESIRPGESWVDAIERGLGESSHTVVVLTPKALKSRWVKKETGVAIAQERKGRIQVIPLDVEPCAVPLLLSSYQMVSFRHDYDAGLRQLADILGMHVTPPEPAHPPLEPVAVVEKEVVPFWQQVPLWVRGVVGGLILLAVVGAALLAGRGVKPVPTPTAVAEVTAPTVMVTPTAPATTPVPAMATPTPPTPTPLPPTDTPTSVPTPRPPTATPTEPPLYPYEIVLIDCPIQEKEVTWVGGGVLDANGELVMDGVVVAYDAASIPGNEHPWARVLESTDDPRRWDVAKMGKKEWPDDWRGKWMNFFFEIYWFNPIMGSQDTYRHVVGDPNVHTVLEWSVWVESPSGVKLSDVAHCKTYSHPHDPDDPEPNGPPQCFIVFRHR